MHLSGTPHVLSSSCFFFSHEIISAYFCQPRVDVWVQNVGSTNLFVLVVEQA
jgi:hypothetical protein